MNNILRLALLIGIVLLAISFNGLIDKQHVISGYIILIVSFLFYSINRYRLKLSENNKKFSD